jgi:manganese transport protein
MLQRARGPRSLRTLAPACIAAVAYVDPGNFGVNVTAGARYGYSLIWVVVLASVMATLIQYLSAKLGIATGRSLAENCRVSYGPAVRAGLGLQALLVVVMTDLAELVGGAIALHMLTGLPLPIGALVIAAVSSLVLVLRGRGRQGFEPVVLGLLGAIVVALGYQLVVSGVDVGALAAGTLPGRMDQPAALLAAGIIGATVMPHALHLHSALSCSGPDPAGTARGAVAAARRTSIAGSATASRSTRRSVILAMTVAGLANVSIMVVAAKLPGSAGHSLQQAQLDIGAILGRTAAVLFALALLASGLASTVVGVFTGQVVVQGFARRPVPLWLRRTVSVVPPLVLLLLGVNATTALVLSQVVLSFTLPGTLLPLVLFTARRSMMGELVNSRRTTIVASAITAVIVLLDAYLLAVTVG